MEEREQKAEGRKKKVNWRNKNGTRFLLPLKINLPYGTGETGGIDT